MKKQFLLSLATGILACFFCSLQAADELKSIKQNYFQLLIGQENNTESLINILTRLPKEQVVSDQMVVELQQRYSPEKTEITKLLSTLQNDGSWPDIDYADNKRSGWLPKNHAERILILAKVYQTPKSDFYKSEKVEAAIHQTLAYWFNKKLVCPNWWYNQIGVPKTLGGAFILFEDKLTPEERAAAIRVMEQSRFGMTGQNKVWLAGNVLVRGLLQNDAALVKAARDTIASEIITGKAEGIKADQSFHQHGAQQQFGNYGAAYISGMSFWSSVFAGTSFAFNQSQLEILSLLANEGYRRILWKGYMDINALGRQFFHNAQRHKALTVGFAAEALAKADLTNRNAYETLIRENFYTKQQASALSEVYHFWKSDQTICRTPAWMASVKMASSRVIGAESGNGDNLKGYYLADGACYTYVDGDEYLNIFPCWDWRKISGITSYHTSDPIKQLSWSEYSNPNAFVGNTGNGKTGITAMVFNRDKLKALKSWIFTQEFILCQGSGIGSDSTYAVTTSIEQRLQRGELTVVNKKNALPRYFHDKTGYILLEPATVTATVQTQSGQWKDVMNMYPEGIIQKEVVSIYINHGVRPANASYQYLILPNTTARQVKAFDTKSIRTISNNCNTQAIALNNNKVFYIAVYTSASLKLTGKLHFQTNTPGLFMIELLGNKTSVTLSDPTQQKETIAFKINDKLQEVTLPSGEEKGTSCTVIF